MLEAFSIEQLKWLLPILIGGLVLIGCAIAIMRGQASWPLTAVAALSAALIGASVFSELTANKDGVTIKMSAAAEGIQSLTTVVQANDAALRTLEKQVSALSSQLQKSGNVSPLDSSKWGEIFAPSGKQTKIEDILGGNQVQFDKLNKLNNVLVAPAQ